MVSARRGQQGVEPGREIRRQQIEHPDLVPEPVELGGGHRQDAAQRIIGGVAGVQDADHGHGTSALDGVAARAGISVALLAVS
ncbi:hypothetical protein [Bradyrhizobium sp. USDA 4504]